jgi:aspartyl aminopeptidase
MAGLPSAADHKIAADLLEFLNEGVTEFHAGVLPAPPRPHHPALDALRALPWPAPLTGAALLAVDAAVRRLKAAGFVELSERQGWEGVQKGGRYFFTRNASTLVAFAVGQQYEPGNGFMMVGAHTDRCASPARVLPPST